nr:molybdopterin-dependent oxidoreductase [uncultured Desulfobacter sp.]
MGNKTDEISRRSFLKVTSALGIGVAAAKMPGKAEAAPLKVPTAEYGREKKVPVLCQMCYQFCPANAYVKDGKVVRMEASPVHEYKGICGRSKAAVGALYSDDRITTPLIRTGKRGDGSFRKPSWDEALDLVGSKLKALRDKGEPEKAVLFSRFSSAPVWDYKFFEVYGTPNIVGYGDTCFNVVSKSSQAILGFGGPGAHSSDWENADYGLVVGKNLGGAIIPHGWGAQFGKGLRRGLPMTIVDPRRPNEMAQSYSHWLPIRPGTDVAFLMGVLHFVFKKNYVDMEFQASTNLDALIDTETLLPALIDKRPTPHDYLVYDTAAGKFVLSRQAQAPAYDGRFEYQGKTVQPAMALLRQSAMDQDVEKLSRMCTIPVDQMEAVADKLGKAAPRAFVEIGYRFTRHTTDFRAQLCVHMLNLLLGLYGVEGGILRNRNPRLGGLPIEFPAPDTSKSILRWQNENEAGRWCADNSECRSGIIKSILEGKPYKPKLLFFWGQDLVGGTAGGKDITDAMTDVETVVAVSPFWQDSVMYADVILPGCTFLEQDQPLYTGYKSLIPVVGVNRKAVDPVMGSKDGYWILCQIAKRVLRKDEYVQYFQELEQKGLRPTWESQFAGIAGLTPEESKTLPSSLDELLDNGSWGSWRIVPEHTPRNSTGKYEVYSFWLAEKYNMLTKKYPDYPDLAHASPLLVDLAPAWMQKKQNLAEDEFVPASGFSPLASFTGAQARNNPILVSLHRKMKYANVFINETRARDLGLDEGDLTDIWMEAFPEEKQRARVSLSKTVHPDVLFHYHGLGKGLLRTPEKLHYAKQIGLNLNHFGRLRFSPGVAGHVPQDIILKIKKVLS